METFHIQTHQKYARYSSPHFFIQSNGYNSGKPSSIPSNNCYVVLTNDELQKGITFWTCFSLWKTDQFLPLLDNSQDLALNKQEAYLLIDKTFKRLSSQPGYFLSNVRELKELIQTEKLLSIQLKIIRKVKVGVARKLLR